MLRKASRSLTPLALAITALTAGQTAIAQQAVLEEITVTAQKREESLKDVPISVNVVDAARLEAGNINKIADLTEFVPNLAFVETGVSTQLYVRGIGSGNNQGFDQSVGQYIDGVYYGRQMLMRAPFLDLKRVEILRGPQGTLFGKNTIAGALNYTTERPTNEKQVSIDALHEFKSDQEEFTVIASGPLNDKVRARFAWRGYNEIGYINNSFKNITEPKRNEDTFRLTLEADLVPDLDASLKIERNNFQTRGRQVEVVRDDPNLFPAGSSPLAGKTMAQILTLFGQPTMDSQLDYTRQANSGEQSVNHIENQTLTLSYPIGDLKLRAITAHLRYDYDETCDCDYTPAKIFDAHLGEKFNQWSQELRVESPVGATFEWLGGVYWHKQDMTSFEVLNVPADSFIKTLALSSTNPAQRALAGVVNTKVVRDNGQISKNEALFFHGKWNITGTLNVSVGGRYTRDDKDAYRRENVLDYNTLAPLTDGVAARVYFGAFKIYTEQLKGLVLAPGVIGLGHNLSGTHQENQFTPMANLEWHVTDNSMLYASASSGYKAGGFDGRSNNPFSFEFKEEKAKAYEIGSKNFFFDRSLEFNIALFYTNYRDLQVSQFDGTFGFNVGNAEKAKVQGVELDGRLALTDTVTFAYAYSYLDFKFTDFQDGNCYNRQVPDGAIVNGVRMCDYTGKDGQYTPKDSYSLALDYKKPVMGEWLLLGSLMYNYRSSQQIHDNHDPNMEIGSVGRVDLRVGIENNKWRFGFVGKNLTGEKVLSYSGNVPLSSSMFGTNTFYAMVERPRQLALEAGYRF